MRDCARRYRVDRGRQRRSPTDEPVDDFSVRNLGSSSATARVRAALLSICGVRPRRLRAGRIAEDSDRLVRDSFSLRDDEQLLVKLSYRFET